jgi:hypothetical protein
MLHNRMMQKKQEMQRPRTRTTQQTEYGQRYIETLQWVLSRKSISIRRLLLSDEDGDGVRYYY